MSANGDFFAAHTADLNRAIFFDVAHNKTTVLSDGSNRSFVAVSPDGRWVARGNYGLSGVEVWDVPTRRIVQEWHLEGSAAVAFSPNGRWLVIAAKVYQFIETGSWQQRYTIPGIGGGNQGGRMAFSTDGQMIAITLACNLIQLIETDTGRVLADLQVTPKPSWVQWLSFGADGSRLAVACGREGIRVWDLRRVRQRLGTMNLDWDLPPYPPATPVAHRRTLQVQVDTVEETEPAR
jgi:WD40 repeat protein